MHKPGILIFKLSVELEIPRRGWPGEQSERSIEKGEEVEADVEECVPQRMSVWMLQQKTVEEKGKR